MDLKKINKLDPLVRNAVREIDNLQGSTPFDPPEAFDDNKKELIPMEDCPELLKQLMDEHKTALKHLDDFEKALVDFKSNGFVLTSDINLSFSEFFKYYDHGLMIHNDKEEKVLFPLLEEKLIENGEHSVGENPSTAIDVMEDDHVKIIQLGTLAFNLFGIATRLKDSQSQIFVCDTAYNVSRELIELLKLHIYREDYTLFPLAYKLLSKDHFDNLMPKAKKYSFLAQLKSK